MDVIFIDNNNNTEKGDKSGYNFKQQNICEKTVTDRMGHRTGDDMTVKIDEQSTVNSTETNGAYKKLDETNEDKLKSAETIPTPLPTAAAAVGILSTRRQTSIGTDFACILFYIMVAVLVFTMMTRTYTSYHTGYGYGHNSTLTAIQPLLAYLCVGLACAIIRSLRKQLKDQQISAFDDTITESEVEIKDYNLLNGYKMFENNNNNTIVATKVSYNEGSGGLLPYKSSSYIEDYADQELVLPSMAPESSKTISSTVPYNMDKLSAQLVIPSIPPPPSVVSRRQQQSTESDKQQTNDNKTVNDLETNRLSQLSAHDLKTMDIKQSTNGKQVVNGEQQSDTLVTTDDDYNELQFDFKSYNEDNVYNIKDYYNNWLNDSLRYERNKY
ncbi:uncharacterized protein LOC128964430 [Oppia nitens]|uniref:uncharacterized protein LOC128964430 n=1 Tax=Oppia nitens TaxID=1686743 RepID=UPI0023DC555B|nr:uncharacterized protein LOC128964430 [Oppia nitens]